jgi:hypothetical protein
MQLIIMVLATAAVLAVVLLTGNEITFETIYLTIGWVLFLGMIFLRNGTEVKS